METIGDKLKAAREKQKMTAAEVAKAVRIKTDYITAIEKNEFHKLIAPVYARGFVKLYAQCVQIDPTPLLRQFDATERREEPAPARPERKLPAKKEVSVLKKLRLVKINIAGLIDPLRKIKLPDISRLKIPALKPIGLPAKKWLVLMVAAAFLIIILSVFIRYITAADARIRVPAACRWIAEPPEPYLDIHPPGAVSEGRVPVSKSQNGR